MARNDENRGMTPLSDDDVGWEALDMSAAVPTTTIPARNQRASIAATTTAAVSSNASRFEEGLRRRRRGGGASSIPRPATTGSRDDSSTGNNNARRRRRGGSHIVDHPMQHITSHFLVHLCGEIWALDWTLRLALACCVAGSIAQLIEWCFWYALYPERLLWTVSILLGAAIPAFFYYKPRIEVFLRDFQFAELNAADALGRCLDSTQLRAFATIWFFVVPAVLELRTLQFLTNLVGGSVSAALLFLSMLGGWCAVEWKKQNDAALSAFDVSLFSPRKCTQTGLYLLYGSALFVTLYHGTTRRHIPSLAARFFLATSVLLYKSTAADPSQAVRAALRRTVRDALQEVGSSVQQNELLQLAMLRWIVDYWASSSTPTAQSATGSSSSGRTASASQSSVAGRRRLRPSQVLQPQHPELDWTELWSMLQTTTNQMASEVETLQHDGVVPSTSASSASARTERPVGNSSSEPSASPFTSASTSGGNTSGSGSSAQDQQFGDSVQSLQAMMAAMNLDERAKPAVLAYKRAVEAFPPSRRVAIALGVGRRCPAIALLSFHVLCVLFGWYRSSVTVLVILLPFAFFEASRIRFWLQACQRASDEGRINEINYPELEKVEPMTILLMDESYLSTSSAPVLLVVWNNIRASVEALEISLTAARCVQTTVVVVDFAANIMSLASFGFEVSQHGWLHGLSIVAKELLHLHTTGTNLSTLFHGISTPDGATYTSAAVSAVRNSQTMSRNIQVLSEEEDTSRMVGPVLGFLALLVGQGWLWGRGHSGEAVQAARETRSTMEIVELDDDGEEISPLMASMLVSSGALTEVTRGESTATVQENTARCGESLLSTADDDNVRISVDAVSEDRTDDLLASVPLQRCHMSCPVTVRDKLPNEKIELSLAVGLAAKADSLKDATFPVSPSTDYNVEIDPIQDFIASTQVDAPYPVPESSFVSQIQVTLDPKPASDSPGCGIVADAARASEMIPDDGSSLVTYEASTRGAATGDAVEDFETELSEMMGLLAQCDELGLLDVGEKNALLEKLAAFGGEKNAASFAWVRGSKCTLRGLLDERESFDAAPTAFGAIHSTGLATLLIPVNVSGCAPCDDDDHLFEPMNGRDFSLGTLESGALSVSSDECSQQEVPCFRSQLSSRVSTSNIGNWDDSHDFEPLVVTQTQNNESPSVALATDNQKRGAEDHEDDNKWLKVGGGLAVLGAVVGGVALIAAQNGGGDDRRRQNGKSDASS